MPEARKFAPGGRRVEGTIWERVMVECSPWEAECRTAYAAAGWPDKGWAYDFMPEWLRPAWHHETDATEVSPRP
jgi:hypothetical protein